MLSDICAISSSIFPSPGLTYTWTPPNCVLVQTFSPAFFSDSIAINANLVLTFNEPVQKGTGSITVFYDVWTTPEYIEAASDKVTVAGNIATIDVSDFKAGRKVTIMIQKGAFKNFSNTDFALEDRVWTFSVFGDTIPPIDIAFSYIPSGGQTDVAKNSNLSMNFYEDIQKGTGNILIYENNSLRQTIDVNGSSVGIFENTLTIDPMDFTPGSLVNVVIPNGTVRDLHGNNYKGNSYGWSFNIKAIDASSVEVSSLYSFNIYPNPTFNILNICTMRKEKTKLSFKLIDLQGRVIYSEIKNDFTGELNSAIDISRQDKGVYLLQIMTDKESICKKIIKN